MVIGNGMAGARAVEEILSRGGAEQFKITMFGDEPYGNYNRIMLSHVLSGEESHDGIFLNTLEWYVENDIVLHAGVRVGRIDRFAHVVFSDDGQVTPYDQLIIATGSRSFMPPMDGLYTAIFDKPREREVARRRVPLPHHRRHPRHGRVRHSR